MPLLLVAGDRRFSVGPAPARHLARLLRSQDHPLREPGAVELAARLEAAITDDQAGPIELGSVEIVLLSDLRDEWPSHDDLTPLFRAVRELRLLGFSETGVIALMHVGISEAARRYVRPRGGRVFVWGEPGRLGLTNLRAGVSEPPQPHAFTRWSFDDVDALIQKNLGVWSLRIVLRRFPQRLGVSVDLD